MGVVNRALFEMADNFDEMRCARGSCAPYMLRAKGMRGRRYAFLIIWCCLKAV